MLSVPTLAEAEHLMAEAAELNPGPWVQHSSFAARAAGLIASQIPTLDPSIAYVLGYLHDIGRRQGVTDLRHILDGYQYLLHQGFADAARICLTHSFPIQNIRGYSGEWDCSPAELDFIQDFLSKVEYGEYDRLIQLCDALALPNGFCLIEKRLVDVALRRGLNELTLEKWKAFLSLQKEFEQVIGQSIYRLLPGVVSSTFGFEIPDC
jgi:hypothetical protein